MDMVSCLCKWKSVIYVCSTPYRYEALHLYMGDFFFDTDGTPYYTAH